MMLAYLLVAISGAFQTAPSADAPLKTIPGDILATYITPDDYPIESLKRNEQGTVNFTVVVATDGHVKSCSIVKSSGSERLDAQTCRIMSERMRFKPAHDSHGNPIEDRFAGKVNWILSPL